MKKIRVFPEQEKTQYVNCLNLLKTKCSVELLTIMLQTGKSLSELESIGSKRFKVELETGKVRPLKRIDVKKKEEARMATIEAEELKSKRERERKNSIESKKREKLFRSIKPIIESFKSIVSIIHFPADFLDALEGPLDNTSLKDLGTLYQESKKYLNLIHI